jgi:hypothetical protein
MMKRRILDPTNKNYFRYGGRGIKVCSRWLESFENFLEDMGAAPPGMKLDRKDNDGDYCKDNCRWTTQKRQCRNKGNNIILTLNGASKCIAEWAEEIGISQNTLLCRFRSNWSHERILTAPLRKW